MYFKNFPQIVYDFNINGSTDYRVITDVTKNVRFRKSVLENIRVYDEYDIREGETPEIISEKFYGSPLYHWVIMLTNERYDYVNDFPLTERELQAHIDQKYGNRREHVHHYVYTDPQTNLSVIKEIDFTIRLQESETIGGTIGQAIPGKLLISTEYGYKARIDEIAVPSDNTYITVRASMRTGNFELGVDKVMIDSNTTLANVVDIDYPANYSLVSNAQYEESVNESKRRIKIIDPTYLSQIIREFEDLL